MAGLFKIIISILLVILASGCSNANNIGNGNQVRAGQNGQPAPQQMSGRDRPDGVATGAWLKHIDANNDFTFEYPDSAEVKKLNDSIHISLPFKKGSNLEMKYLNIRTWEQAEGDCHHQALLPASSSNIYDQNGIKYIKETALRVAGGMTFESENYLTRKGLKCYAFSFNFRSIGEMSNDNTIKYDRQEEQKIISEIMNTVSFK